MSHIGLDLIMSTPNPIIDNSSQVEGSRWSADTPGALLRGPVLVGYLVVALFFGGLGTWAALAPIAGATIATGVVSPEGSRKTIQHLEGGIITEILVNDGDRVKAGDRLVVLQETQARAAFEVLQGKQHLLAAKLARLLAEQAGEDKIHFPERLLVAAEAGDMALREVLQAQRDLFAARNELHAGRDLPGFFWDGRTRMNCMRHALGQSLEFAYAHHIQRLMISGNFCLLAGVDPDQVDAWYLGVYVDAIEWVEMPNTRGMSQFADGGLIATKPYAAGANYIGKMSDYCADCEYDRRDRTSPKSCPFNSLYWHFMYRHRERLGANPRIGMVYRNWDRQDPAARAATLERAAWCLEHLDEL